MPPLPEPLRGEVWDADFLDFGEHPAVVLSINPLNTRLGHVAVVTITGTRGPEATHIPLNRDAGLTRYDESFADITALQPIDRLSLLSLRGRLAAGELSRIESQLKTYLGL